MFLVVASLFCLCWPTVVARYAVLRAKLDRPSSCNVDDPTEDSHMKQTTSEGMRDRPSTYSTFNLRVQCFLLWREYSLSI